MVAAEFPEVELTVNTENLGFSAANNVALRRSEADYVLVLNPDTRLTEGALDALLGLLAAKPEVGICGPRLERPDGSFDHASRRSFPRLERPRSLQRHRSPARLRPAGCLSGTGCRARPGRRRERRVHADPSRRARPGRPLRRGLLDVHGGPRPLLPLQAGRLAGLVRAGSHGRPREGRDHGSASLAAAEPRFPRRHAPFLPRALRGRPADGPERGGVCGDRDEARGLDPARRDRSAGSARFQ